jgi:hypothetical protein
MKACRITFFLRYVIFKNQDTIAMIAVKILKTFLD